MDGLELARCVRSDPALSHIFMVALTGYGQSTDRITALNAGFDEHIVKPVRVDELLRLLTVEDRAGARDGVSGRDLDGAAPVARFGISPGRTTAEPRERGS